METKGILISFEGPDGAGKTSVLKTILNRLKPIFDDRLIFTREPGGANNPLAEEDSINASCILLLLLHPFIYLQQEGSYWVQLSVF